MRRESPVFVIFVLLLVALLQPSCVISRGGPCEVDSQCEAYNVCFRNWCMPEKVRDRLLRVIEQQKKQDAGPADQVSRPDTAPDTRPDTTPDSSCAIQCQPGTDTRPCYPEKTAGCDAAGTCIGACKAGTQTCESAGACPTWSACVGAKIPEAETCDGKDNNCDGTVDEALTRPCYSGPAGTQNVGECKGGTETCSNGAWGACTGEVTPATEICDNQLDENCDGQADEGCDCKANETRPCGSKEGECKEGTQACGADNKWGQCAGDTGPQAETCDGKDNNCDGKIDEGLTQACYSGATGTQGKGECKDGTQTCTAGQWGTCSGEIIPATEICDNKDNDCDGNIDGITRPCYTGPANTKGKGECKDGTQTCAAGQWGVCNGEVTPKTELCDGLDNNCDGAVDEGCECKAGETGKCGNAMGTCVQGSRTCKGDGTWGNCSGGTGPVAEVCDGKDNDCDGQVDNGIQPRSCYSGPPSTQNVGLCKSGAQACVNGAWETKCQGEVLPQPEICDGKDNNCNTQNDDGIAAQACYTGPTNTQGVGECKGGTKACTNGVWGACTGEVIPLTEEKCDGKDHDCNGKIDNGCVTTFAGSGTPGFQDGKGTAAQLKEPKAIITVGNDMYFIDAGNYSIRHVDDLGQVTTIAGDGTHGDLLGPALSAKFNEPCGIEAPSFSNIYITEKSLHTIKLLSISQSNPSLNKVLHFAGQQIISPGFVNGDLSVAKFDGPCGIVIDTASGDMYVADLNNYAIRKIAYSSATNKYIVSTFTGGNGTGQTDGAKGVAQFQFGSFSSGRKLVFHQGKLYVNDTQSIRVVDTNGTVSTYVGFPQTNATFQTIAQAQVFSFDPQGNIMYFVAGSTLYRTDPPNLYVKNFTSTSILGYLDGPLSSARFRDLQGITFSNKGELFVTDSLNHRIRKITLP